jgi:hypothetical protein
MTQSEHMWACAALNLACDKFYQQKMAQITGAQEGQCNSGVVVVVRNAYFSLRELAWL